MANPNFTASISTNELYRDLDTTVCLTDLLDGYDSDIDDLQDAIAELDTTYATINHTHSGYALSTDVTALQDAIGSKANSTHTHTEYAPISHTHSEYASQGDVDALEIDIADKANSDHTHVEYATFSHTHDNYAVANHDHDDDYAAIGHTHGDYATVTALNEVSAAVSGKANASHAHDDRYYTESEIDSKLAAKADTSHDHDDDYDASGAASSALTSANAYTDSKINALVGEGASTTLDTIGEISSAIEDNQDAIDLLNSAIGTKANATDLTSHTGNTAVHVTATERSNWNAAKTHADTAHAPSNAEANQNAFSNVVVGDTTISADTKTDTLTLVAGSNVTIAPSATNDSVTIAATDTVYTHPTTAGNKHIPAGGSSGQILRWSADGTAVWGSDNNTTYSAATQSAAGLMSAADKTKLDGIATGANNYTYTLPSAGTSLGGVKTGGDVTISAGVITVNDDSHNHVISNIDGLQSALDAKAASSHSHDDDYYTRSEIDAQVSGLNTSIAGKASSSHTHTIANVTNLQSSLDAKVPTSRTVNGKALTANITLSASDIGADASGTAATQAAAALQSAKNYADDIKDDLLNGAGAAYDTLKELGDLIDDNADAIDALETVAASKASSADLTAHISNTSNPHGVTLSQLGVTATASELNYVDGATSNIQTQLNGKAAASHGTHVTYGTSAPNANGAASAGSASTVSRSDHVHPLQTTVSGNAGTATKLATARTISLTGDVTGSVSFDGSANASITATVADDSHNHTIANIDGLQTALNVKSDNDHRHYPIPIVVTGQDLNDYTDAGFYTFAAAYAPANAPSGNTNGWLLVVPWVQGNATIKQFWFRHGSVGSNDFETFVRTRVGSNAWGSWSKYYTTSNPPTAAEVGAISKSLQFTDNNGSFKLAYDRDDNKNILTEIAALPTGFYTVYSQSGVTGNPKDTEAWRFMVHKTSANTGWVQGYGSIGSVYTNYLDGADNWRGWQCIYDTAPPILWMGEYWITDTQTVTPSKPLSKCRNGWVLVWSDYDTANEKASNGDCYTTVIPKWNPNHVKWSGQSFIATIPSGLNDSGVVTFAGKRMYVHDTKITGHTVNDVAPSNDVCLRAIYEY